jgi:hypothetical protein
MRLYRGIAVPEHTAKRCIDDIRSKGLVAADGRWRFLFHDLKSRLEELWQRPIITRAETRPNDNLPDWVCACAEQAGALYYACYHNRSKEHNAPLLIVFDAELKDIIVDGRDFLYTLFQLGEPTLALPVAIRLFGPAISRYLNRAWATDDQKQRVALCDLAIQDESVIVAHAANQTVIGGRYGTIFRSAFMVRAPIAAHCILDVRVVDKSLPVPSIDVGLQAIIRKPTSIAG